MVTLQVVRKEHLWKDWFVPTLNRPWSSSQVRFSSQYISCQIISFIFYSRNKWTTSPTMKNPTSGRSVAFCTSCVPCDRLSLPVASGSLPVESVLASLCVSRYATPNGSMTSFPVCWRWRSVCTTTNRANIVGLWWLFIIGNDCSILLSSISQHFSMDFMLYKSKLLCYLFKLV